MPEYICKKCKHIFNKKSNYERHINGIKDCVTGSKTSRKNFVYCCEGCDKKFSRRDILNKHKKKCADFIENKQNNNIKSQIRNRLFRHKNIVSSRNKFVHKNKN